MSLNEMEAVKEQLEKLKHMEAAYKAKFSQGAIPEEEYRKAIAMIDQQRKKLDSQMDDSIVAMMFIKEPQPGVLDLSDSFVQKLKSGEVKKPSPGDTAVSAMRITEMKRGMMNNARALEVKFEYRGKTCKAIIDSQEGQWHFNSSGEKFYLFQFLSALENNGYFEEGFEKEARRHPEDWFEVVVEGKKYAEKGKEKNTRDNFPAICKQSISQYLTAMPDKQGTGAGKKAAGDLTGEPIIIYKVEHGEWTEMGRKDFGKGVQEFPRFITVTLDWGKYRLKARISTMDGEWEVVPRDVSDSYPKEMLKQFKHAIPFMVQELGQPRNKYLANAILTEMRIKEHRHQWQPVVKSSGAFTFPNECKSLFSASELD